MYTIYKCSSHLLLYSCQVQSKTSLNCCEHIGNYIEQAGEGGWRALKKEGGSPVDKKEGGALEGGVDKTWTARTHISSLHCPLHFICLQQLGCLSEEQHRSHSSKGNAAKSHLGFVEGELVFWEGRCLNELIKETQHFPKVFRETLKACPTHISLTQS